MRLTAMGLIAALTATAPLVATGTVALAQPAPDPATAPAPAQPDPAAAPAAPASATPEAAPVAPPAAVEPPPPPAPPVITLPTSGDGAYLISVIEKVCVPAVQGGNLDVIAKANGFKKNRDGWIAPFGAKPYTILVSPAGSNPTVCNLTIDHVQNGVQPMVDGLNAWAYLHQPSLQLYRNDEYPGADFKRRTISWEYLAPDGGSTGLVFVGLKKPDGSAVSKVGDRSTLYFQIRPAG